MSGTGLCDVRVLVTGATGFIGSRLAERLATQEGARVTGVGRRLEPAEWLRDHGVQLRPLDLTDATALEGAVEGMEVVFHLAGALAPDPDTAHAVNVRATEELVRLAGRAFAASSMSAP